MEKTNGCWNFFFPPDNRPSGALAIDRVGLDAVQLLADIANRRDDDRHERQL